MVEDEQGVVSLSNLVLSQQQILITRILQQVFQILEKTAPLDPSTHIFLDNYGVLGSLLEVKAVEVSRLVPSEQTLDQNGRTVSLETSLEPINVHLKIELVLFCAWLVTVVCYVPFHEFVEGAESISKRRIFDTLLVSDYELIESPNSWQWVHQEVSVARNGANRIWVESDVEHAGQSGELLQVLPLWNVIVVQVQKLEFFEAAEHVLRRQTLNLVVAEVDFLEIFETYKVAEVLERKLVPLQIQNLEIFASWNLLKHLVVARMSPIVHEFEREDLDLVERFAVRLQIQVLFRYCLKHQLQNWYLNFYYSN